MPYFCISMMTIAVVDLLSLNTRSCSTSSSHCSVESNAGGASSLGVEMFEEPSGRLDGERVRSTSPDGYSTQNEEGLPKTVAVCTFGRAATTGATGGVDMTRVSTYVCRRWYLGRGIYLLSSVPLSDSYSGHVRYRTYRNHIVG